MKQRQLVIINNNLEDFSNLFSVLKQTLPFEVTITTIDQLLHGNVSQNISSARIYDTLLAIESSVFLKTEIEIREYFKVLFQSPFINVMQLYTNQEVFSNTMLHNPNENCYILYKEMNQDLAANFFHLFAREIFAKSTIAFRLSDYIYNSFKGVVYSEILKQKKVEIERLNQELEQRNRIDPLTNLFNRRALFEFLEKERNRTLRNLFKIGNQPLQRNMTDKNTSDERRTFTPKFIEGNIILFSVMMIDLDKFKEINDTYGHLAGDVVLKTVGTIFRNAGILREQDIVGRFGGEEFIVILPGTTALNAKKPALRLAQELEKQSFENVEGTRFKVTMSIGISEYHPQDESGDAIIQRADKALYTAKETGRNRTVVYEEAFPE